MNYAKSKKFLKTRKYGFETILMLIGCFTMAFGIAVFLVPNQLSSGGFSGLATIGYYFLNIPIGVTILVLNIPLFILGYVRLGKKFLLTTIMGTFLLSIFIDLLEQVPSLTEDRFLASIYGGIIIGIGSAINLKVMVSTGGSDLLAYIIRSFKPHYQTSTLIIMIDVVIVGLNVIFFKDIEVGLYSAIVIYIMGKMIDIIFEGVNFTKIMFIISDRYQEIAKEIQDKIERGATGIYAKGMYTNEDKMMLLCVGSRNEISKTKQIATSIDKKAFIIISNARETWGKGFKKDLTRI